MCLGFSLNMKSIVKTVFSQEEVIMRVTSSCSDKKYVNENIMSANEVKKRLESFGFTSKGTKHLKDVALVLGLVV